MSVWLGLKFLKIPKRSVMAFVIPEDMAYHELTPLKINMRHGFINTFLDALDLPFQCIWYWGAVSQATY